MPPTPRVDDVDLDLLLRQLGDLVLDRLERARDVGLEHQASSLTSPSWARLKTSSSDTLRPERRASISVFRRCRALAGELARAALVLDDAHDLAGLRHAVEAEHLDRLARLAPLTLPRRSRHRADLAPVRARDERVADLERAALDQHRHDRAAAGVELGLDRPRLTPRRRGLALSSCRSATTWIVSSRPSRPSLGLRRHVDELGVAAPLRGLQAELGHLGAHARGVGALLVDLVDRDEHRHLGCLRVVDRLLGLRLDAVVGGDHDHRDVGDLGAARAHRRERLVARSVEERDRPSPWWTW